MYDSSLVDPNADVVRAELCGAACVSSLIVCNRGVDHLGPHRYQGPEFVRYWTVGIERTDHESRHG